MKDLIVIAIALFLALPLSVWVTGQTVGHLLFDDNGQVKNSIKATLSGKK